MAAVFTLLVVIVVSMLTVRIAAIALERTGVSRSLARFQARSAFTGTGFTTSESEKIVAHPVRRKIVALLMLMGNAGLVTCVATVTLSLTQDNGSTVWVRVGVAAVGLAFLWLLASSRWVDRRVSALIAWALERWTDVDARDYAGLLHLQEDYVVVEMAIEKGGWLEGKALHEVRLSEEGVLVLGIESAGGEFVGAPRGKTVVHADDTLLLYGSRSQIERIDRRRGGREGNRDHVDAVADARKRQLAEEERRAVAEAKRPTVHVADDDTDPDTDLTDEISPERPRSAHETNRR